MSELKVFYSPDAEYSKSYYLKSDADKVIAGLRDKLRAANEQVENIINSASSIMLLQDRVNDNKCAELRHHKYKRCQNMMLYCTAMWHRYMEAEIKERLQSGCCDSKYSNFYSRWRDKWQDLAEKFKSEGKGDG